MILIIGTIIWFTLGIFGVWLGTLADRSLGNEFEPGYAFLVFGGPLTFIACLLAAADALRARSK